MIFDAAKRLEVNGGRVERTGNGGWRLVLPPQAQGYGDAQLYDYGGARRSYPWRRGTMLRLRARFSHPANELRGTAGFGFWNAPFGDAAVRWPTLPQAAWFFFGSPPNDLPLAPYGQAGRGWFASTVDASRWRAVGLAPFAPLVMLLNRWPAVGGRVWPWVQAQLGMSYAPLAHDLTAWHEYALSWEENGCRFWVDGELVLATEQSPRGPLGWVCWMDNQYLVVRGTGRVGWGVLETEEAQWLEVETAV